MRTTLTLPDDIYEVARRHAEDLHIPLGEFIQTAMRQALTPPTRADQTAAIPPYQPPRIHSGLCSGLSVEQASAAADLDDDAIRAERLRRT